MPWPRVRRLVAAGFAGSLLGAQVAVILVSHARGDRRFSFQMFAETTYFRAELLRELPDGTTRRVRNGRWSVAAPSGPRTYAWAAFVRDFHLDHLDRWSRAKQGIGVTLTYFQHALDYVAARIPEDRETVRLVLEVEYETAGGRRARITLRSARRAP